MSKCVATSMLLLIITAKAPKFDGTLADLTHKAAMRAQSPCCDLITRPGSAQVLNAAPCRSRQALQLLYSLRRS